MKKSITFIITGILLILLFAGGSFILYSKAEAKTKNPTAVTNSQKNQQDDQEEEVEDETDETDDTTESQSGYSSQAQVQNSIRKMERLQEEINNPEVGEEIRQTTETQTQANIQINEKLQQMEARPGLLKFILGPDYKNAGEVRSAIVRLQNTQRQMTRIRERLTNPDDIATIDEALAGLESSITEYKDLLSEKLTGFSLFGWLSKLLSGYTQQTTPSPSTIPSESPEASPSTEPEPSQTPEVTVTPTT